MNKTQKKMLTRIVIAAAMLVALHFLPVMGLVRLALKPATGWVPCLNF